MEMTTMFENAGLPDASGVLVASGPGGWRTADFLSPIFEQRASGAASLDPAVFWSLRFRSSPQLAHDVARRRTATEPDVFTLTVAEKLRELQAALSVNKSQLARILRVTRPTVYDWLAGGEPNRDNLARIHILLRCVTDASVSGARPLNARFLGQPDKGDATTLVDLLQQPNIDEDVLGEEIKRVKTLSDAARERDQEREARLRREGFEEVDAEQRKANLATTAALMGWPGE